MKVNLKVYSLGSGGAIQSSKRDNTAFLFIFGNNPLLIDFPGSPCKKIEALGINSLLVRTAIITHHHVDHVYGIPSFFHNHWLRLKNKIGLPEEVKGDNYSLVIFLPKDAITTVESLIKIFGFDMRPQMFPFELRACEMKEDCIELWDGWQMVFYPANHGGIDCFSIIFKNKIDGLKIALSGDSEPFDHFLKEASGANLLIHDCQTISTKSIGHSNAVSLANAISRYEAPKYLVPVHIEGIPEDPGIEIQKVLKRLTKSQIIIPEDGKLLFNS